MQASFDWSADVHRPVATSASPVARHCSATGAQFAGRVLGDLAVRYLALLRHGRATDHHGARALGVGLSSINSTRNAVRRYVIEAGTQRIERPCGRSTSRTYWRLRTAAEIAQFDEECATCGS